MCCFDVTHRRDPPPERQLNFQLYDLIGPQQSASAHSRFGTDSRIDVKLVVCRCRSQMDPLRPFLLAKETVVHYIKWAIWHAETHACRVFSAGWLQHLVNVCPIAPLSVQSQFLFFFSSHSFFFLLPSFFLFYTHHMSCCFFISLPFSLLSPLHLTLIFAVLPPFFFLDYDFGDIFPVLQSLPSADWEGGTLVNPSPAFCIPPSAMFATVYAYAFCMLDILKPLLMRKHTVS